MVVRIDWIFLGAFLDLSMTGPILESSKSTTIQACSILLSAWSSQGAPEALGSLDKVTSTAHQSCQRRFRGIRESKQDWPGSCWYYHLLSRLALSLGVYHWASSWICTWLGCLQGGLRVRRCRWCWCTCRSCLAVLGLGIARRRLPYPSKSRKATSSQSWSRWQGWWRLPIVGKWIYWYRNHCFWIVPASSSRRPCAPLSPLGS